MKKSRNILHFCISAALSLFIVDVHSAVTLCAGEKLPEITGVTLTCATTLGIFPNTGIDLSGQINASMPSNGGIFFPAGDYIVNHNIILRTDNSLVGSETGITLFTDTSSDSSAEIGNPDYSPVVKNLTIKGLIFNNLIVHFYGNKSNINIINNAFINTINKDVQLSVSHNPFVIRGNILLRDEDHPGVGLSTYRNTKTLIEHNIIGDISDAKRISTLNYYDTDTFNIVNKIKQAATAGRLVLKDDQGNFQSGWYATDGLNNSTFNKNVISGNTKSCLKIDQATGDCTIGRDHVTYIKQYNNVDVTNNYYNGWPTDASGSVKFRNATNLYFSGNYLDNVEFDARPYSTSDTASMDNTFIFNNFLKEAMVSFWQDTTDTDTVYISAKNFVVFDNVFNTQDKKLVRISSTWRNTHGEFLESNNLYPDFTSVLTANFQHIDINEAKARLPEEKSALLSLKPIPLWTKIGQINGPDLAENKLARLDIDVKGYKNQFVVYDPQDSYSYPAYRWAPGLTKEFNAKIKGACAGILTNNVVTDNTCKFMGAIGSSYLNDIYTTEGESANYTINIIDKYRQTGTISGQALQTGQSVKLSVTFEDGTKNEVIYTPASDYWMAAHRWTKALAIKINSDIPGLCAGQYNGVKNKPTEGTKCSFSQPVASSYLNNVYTINGQSAVMTLSVISQ
ncbi:hypothetical protein [Rahnella inusitata]|uniref:hypothetical protein n=1 Tax=Rahnella inusitata TaxID=58169 RepID=UPI0039AF90C3